MSGHILSRFVLPIFVVFVAPVCAAAEQATSASRQVGDFQNYLKGKFGGYLAPFNANGLQSGVDFENHLTVKDATFPDNSTITWRWPDSPCASICGFFQIFYGDYAGGPKDLIAPKRVNEIATLRVAHDLSFSGTKNGYDIIYDIFLTDVPHGDRLFEIEIFLHTPPYSEKFVADASPTGSFADDGVTWNVAVGGGPDILFVPEHGTDISIASIDIKKMLGYLLSKKIIAGTEWYSGHALGVEPRNGSGSLVFHSLKVTYE